MLALATNTVYLRRSIALTLTRPMSSAALFSLADIRAHALTSTAPRVPKRIEPTITLTSEENKICTLIDEFTKELRKTSDEYAGVECRIAGGWVRDKLLSIPSNDIDIALADIMGVPFAEKLQAYMISKGIMAKPSPRPGSRGGGGTIATIGRNPEQSKHLETARMVVLDRELDFVNLRSETYAEDSRIPTIEIGTPLQDALRRDMTINALFYNIHTKSVEDFTSKGLDDLRDGIVRTPLNPTDTFRDDPLRVLRCVRFASRLGFKIDEEATSAMREQSIQDALVSKISRERVGEELVKMIKGSTPLQSLSAIDTLGLYTSIFGIPPVFEGKTTGAPQPLSTAIQAASILSEFLDSTSTFLPAPHPLLLDHVRTNPEARRNLILAAALTPWKDMVYLQKKRNLPLAEGILREGLKVGGHSLTAVPNLFSAHELISNPSLESFEGTSERSKIGFILRDKKVHNPQSGTHWSASVLFSLVQDLVEHIKDEHLNINHVEALVRTYNAFVSRVEDLNLIKSIEEPSLLNGKQVCALLEIKPGKEVGAYLDHIVRWQLDHPDEDLELCKAWLKQAHRSGSILKSPRSEGCGDAETVHLRKRARV